MFFMRSLMVVRDHIPLEQGLRHKFKDHPNAGDSVRDHIPLEQGLRHNRLLAHQSDKGVRDHIPLEQGLRHLSWYSHHLWKIPVRDHIPLEQGLRHGSEHFGALVESGQRPYSIRTRIKTIFTSDVRLTHHRQRPYSIRTRIKTTAGGYWWGQTPCQRPYSIRTRIKTRRLRTARRASFVRDHIPLEQGLRHVISRSDNSSDSKSETIFH